LPSIFLWLARALTPRFTLDIAWLLLDKSDQLNGSMRRTIATSDSCTPAGEPSWRLRLLLFFVRMWRRCDWPRLKLPVPVFLKRLAAPRFVFNFGIALIS
jgi:hypothetical protein